jgi:CDP-2,3-bis-(O-geranylgeranyl)-sn-glycerol synthase
MRALQLIYLMLPIYVANMAPPFVKYWHGWNRPISVRWLGSHKTIIGFGTGIAAALAVSLAQAMLAWEGSLIPPRAPWWLVGLAAGFGAMAGDSLKSLAKRRIGIAPGTRWVPFDQLDFIVGGLIAMSFFVRLGWDDIALVCVISFAGDIAVNHLSFFLRIRETRW